LWHDQSSAVICLRRCKKKQCDRAFGAVAVRILIIELVLIVSFHEYLYFWLTCYQCPVYAIFRSPYMKVSQFVPSEVRFDDTDDDSAMPSS
jgi:hypothetical protein